MLETSLKFLVGVATFLSMMLVFILLIGFPVKWAMNYLFAPSFLTAVFGVAQMTFWRVFWLAFICGALFKSSIRIGK